MRRYILFLLLCCAPALADDVPVGAYAAGAIDDAAGKQLRVRYYRTLADMATQHASIDSSTIGADGRYLVGLRITRPTLCEFYVDGDLVTYGHLVRPGDTIVIDRSTDGDMMTVRIAGTPEAINDFLIDFDDRFHRDSTAKAERFESMKLEPPAFVRWLDSVRTEQLEFMAEYWRGRAMPTGLDEYFRSHVDVAWANDRLQHLWKHRRAVGLKGVVPADSAYLAPVYALLRRPITPLTDRRIASVLRELFYVIHLDSVERTRARGEDIRVRQQYPERYENAVRTLDGEARDIAVAGILHEWVAMAQRFGDPSDDNDTTVAAAVRGAIAYLERFRSFATKPEYPAAVERAIESARQLAPGRTAPPWTMRGIDGTEVSLADLRGKLVYMEFWATNCAPCIAELPSTLELQKRFAGRDVAFVYISLDQSDERWRRFLELHGFSGIHVRDPDGYSSSVAATYAVAGIPRYFIIDREGTIVTSDAPRPSMGAADVIDRLLVAGK